MNKRTLHRGMLPILNELSLNSLKCSSVDQLIISIGCYVSNWDRLWSFYGHKWFRRKRFDLKIKSQQAYDEAANRIIGKDRKTLAVFGDAFWDLKPRGLSSGPVASIMNYVAAKLSTVILVDEYNTSKMCSTCCTKLVQRSSVYALFNCKSCIKTWNRDVNASLNMETIFNNYRKGGSLAS